MATFADFVLLRALPSYGGAEVLRARRVRAGGRVDEPVHLGLFGTDPRVAERLVKVAAASAQVKHEAVSRIVEVGRCDDALYAVAEAAEGVDLSTLLEFERRRRAAPDPKFVIAVAFSLARVVQDLHDRGDVWATDAVGLHALAPAGIRADAITLRKDGAVMVRVLAGAADHPQAATPFRAPEVVTRGVSAAADVFTVTQVLRALLAVDPTAQAPPRLPPRGGALPTLLVGALQPRPEDRPLLDGVIQALRDAFADNAPNTSPAAIIANALRREYRPLLFEDVAREEVSAAAHDEVTTWLSSGATRRSVLYPKAASEAPTPASFDDDAGPTLAIPRFRPTASSGVDRVFTEEADTKEGSVPSSEVNTDSLPSGSETGARPRSESILDVAAATFQDAADGELGAKTHKALHRAIADSGDSGLDHTGEGSAPWASAVEVSSWSVSDEPPADVDPHAETRAGAPPFAAPVFADSDLEHGDTVEIRGGVSAPRDVSFPSDKSGEAKPPKKR